MRKILLTTKEKRIIFLICQEFTSAEIASKMNFSLRTVEDYRAKIQKKIGATNSIGVALYAVKAKIYPLKNIRY